MFCISHDRDIAPLDGEPVGQTEDRDGGAVGPAGIQLKYKVGTGLVSEGS